jgi:Family of unknown function (DUF6325)
MGPVQVLVVGFDRPTFSGEVLAELTRLREAGIVRLVDLLLVARAEDGSIETVTPRTACRRISAGWPPPFSADPMVNALSQGTTPTPKKP